MCYINKEIYVVVALTVIIVYVHSPLTYTIAIEGVYGRIEVKLHVF
jgi:hypothetical protein